MHFDFCQVNRKTTSSDPKTRSTTPDLKTDALVDGRKSPKPADLLVAPLTTGQIVALMADLETLRKKVSITVTQLFC